MIKIIKGFLYKFKPRLLKHFFIELYHKSTGKPRRIFIYSYGGSGTRTFYEFVKKYKLVNGQSNVHWDIVDNIRKTDRVIYLYSDLAKLLNHSLGKNFKQIIL